MTPVEGITATPTGAQNVAAVPVPSANAVLPLPASVVATPRGVTSRMRWLPKSATTITPDDGMTEIPVGAAKAAAAPVPSAKVWPPLPASVVTTPRGVTNLMRLLFVSATTITLLEGITETSHGWLKLAAVPVPSAKSPELLRPASVVTTPPGYVTSRMRKLYMSATTILPLEGIKATP